MALCYLLTLLDMVQNTYLNQWLQCVQYLRQRSNLQNTTFLSVSFIACMRIFSHRAAHVSPIRSNVTVSLIHLPHFRMFESMATNLKMYLLIFKATYMNFVCYSLEFITCLNRNNFCGLHFFTWLHQMQWLHRLSQSGRRKTWMLAVVMYLFFTFSLFSKSHLHRSLHSIYPPSGYIKLLL